MPRLWVCWTRPSRYVTRDTRILSFLGPADEEALETQNPERVIRARELSLKVRGEALELYVSMIARAGLVGWRGNTFRKALASPGEAGPWWYHPSVFKDCESDPAFEWLHAALIVRLVAREQAAGEIELWGAPSELVEALGGAFRLKAHDTLPRVREWVLWVRGLASRLKWTLWFFRTSSAARSVPSPDGAFDAAFVGFWDWSVTAKKGELADRYFKALPDEVKKRGGTAAHFAWLDPEGSPAGGRPVPDLLELLRGRRDVVLLQAFLRAGDILRALFDFRPARAFSRLRRRSGFRRVFRARGMDLYPLLRERLLKGFLNASLPRGVLAALAVERACRRHKTKLLLSFLEHFPFSRAAYEGARRAGTDTCAVQHACYCRGKSFLFLHPSIELRGEPDGCPTPQPGTVFAMGGLGRELFLECGYPEGRVRLTGSPRYDHVSAAAPPLAAPPAGKPVILMLPAMGIEIEIEMVEAVCEATRDLGDVELVVRDHRFDPVTAHPRFPRFARRVSKTSRTLEEDLSRARVVLFSYSTAGEEALLRGRPVWQWMPRGFDASALAEAADIPRFGSVSGLRKAFEEHLSRPEASRPGEDQRKAVAKRLFGPADGGAAGRIAEAVLECLSEDRRKP